MSKSTNQISVQRRGTFAEDNFFKDSWDEWDRAMNDAVSRWNEHTGNVTTTKTTLRPAETKSVYRKIRSSNVTSDESQAVSCTEEDDRYKMVMDVKDFNPEDINVKVVDDTIVVEGKIEKKEGNAITTQKFTRRFLLPRGINMGAISSALSRDGVLTISAPKLPNSELKSISTSRSGDNTITRQIMGSNPRSSYTYVNNPPAGKPSSKDYGPFNPTGGRSGDIYVRGSSPDKSRFTETVVMNVPDRRGSSNDGTKWTSFNTMVEKSQREMDDMMRRHTLTPDTVIDPQPLSRPIASSAVVMSPAVNAAGVNVSRDVVHSGNTTTHRQEQKWDDTPAPGLMRKNRDYEEKSEIRGDDGTVIGNKMRSEKESHAKGEREEVLPDGTKCKIFTKSYETKNRYTASTGSDKAL